MSSADFVNGLLTELARAEIPVGVMVAPVIPALTDHELEAILIRARQAGAGRAGYIVLRLPLELKELFQEWLAEHAPDRERRVLTGCASSGMANCTRANLVRACAAAAAMPNCWRPASG